MNLRKIIPIFNFKFDNVDIEFIHTGEYDGAKYNINLKHHGQVSLAYLNGDEGFKSNYENFMKGLDESIKQKGYYLEQTSILPFNFLIAEYFLIIDVIQEELPLPEFEFKKSSTQIELITNYFLRTLHLHSSNGIYYEKKHSYRFPLEKYNSINLGSNPFDIWFNPAHKPSILKQEEFENCKTTFLSFLNNRSSKTARRNITNLAYSYHRTSFNMVLIPHKFLIFMVIFESLFKKENERNLNQASIRISKLLSTLKSDQKTIKKEFYDNPDPFRRLRNQIVHGDPNLDEKIVQEKFPKLYKYITEALIKIIQIPREKIDDNKDYNEEIEKYIDNYYTLLS